MGDYEDFILLKSLFDFFSQVGMFAICLHYKSLQISGQFRRCNEYSSFLIIDVAYNESCSISIWHIINHAHDKSGIS